MFNVSQEITAGNVLIREAIQSQNFVTGVSGWQIKANGDAEFNNVTIRGRIIGGDETGVHIEINGADAPNGIAFYTGDAAETFPGVIQPNSSAFDLSVTHSSPLVAGHAGSSLALSTGKGAADDSAQLGTENLLLSGSVNASMTGPIIGATGINSAYYLNTDGTGQYADIIAPRIFLRDNSAGANDNGLVAIGPLIQPITSAWTAMTLVNGWVDLAGSRAGYYKDATGRVQFRGIVISGTAAATITTLPAGFRPSQSMEWLSRGAGGVVLCAFQVSTAGVLTAVANNATVSASGAKLDMISYPTL